MYIIIASYPLPKLRQNLTVVVNGEKQTRKHGRVLYSCNCNYKTPGLPHKYHSNIIKTELFQAQ